MNNEKQIKDLNITASELLIKANELLRGHTELIEQIERLKQPEFDLLSILPVDTQVLCGLEGGGEPLPRFYAGNNKCFAGDEKSMEIYWDNITLDPDAKNIYALNEHNGGECPVDGATFVKVLYRKGGGLQILDNAKRYDWPHDGSRDDIMAYAVIE